MWHEMATGRGLIFDCEAAGQGSLSVKSQTQKP